MIRVGINGIGRIGKLVFRLIARRGDMQVAVVNDPMPMQALMHLFRYDTVHGRFDLHVGMDELNQHILVNGHRVRKYDASQPANIPWNEHGVDAVIDSSGHFLYRHELAAHLKEGVKQVILSCPPAGELDNMVVLGVNHESLDAGQQIISNASCTTNCIAPLIQLLHARWGIDRAFMNTVHPYTNSQNVTDGPHADLRRARCANQNIIPTTTSAIRAVQEIIPEMKGRFDGFASRVPVSDGSFVELNAILRSPASKEQVNELFKAAAGGQMKGIIEYTEDPIVSSDVIGNPHSAIFDGLSTRMLGKDFLQVLAWYDNEYAYANRLVELITRLPRLG